MTRTFNDRQVREAEEAARAIATSARALRSCPDPRFSDHHTSFLLKHLSDAADALGFDLVERNAVETDDADAWRRLSDQVNAAGKCPDCDATYAEVPSRCTAHPSENCPGMYLNPPAEPDTTTNAIHDTVERFCTPLQKERAL